MENEIILVKYGEIILKGHNRGAFERVLIQNIRKALNQGSVSACQATIYIKDLADIEQAMQRLTKVFGIVRIVRTLEIEKSIDVLYRVAPLYLKETLGEAKTFKVETRRADKCFPLKSPEISAGLGEVLLNAYPHLRVDVVRPDVQVEIEVRETGIYIHGVNIAGSGGLPVGTSGSGLLMLSGGLDSPVAGYMMAKRGLSLGAIYFSSPPYTSEKATEKVVELKEQLAKYSPKIPLFVIPFTEQLLEIKQKCDEQYLTIIMRRLFMRVANEVAKKDGYSTIITGESLGQVASQTIWALNVTDQSAECVVCRPLIGMDKQEIVDLAKKIDTYDISIQPYADCCSVFVPRNPSTRPRLERVVKSEATLDIERLIQKALKEAVIY